jgi:DNA-binding MarR family transcriptional regulator
LAGDERKVLINLTPRGWDMREQAAHIPYQLLEGLNPGSISLQDLTELRDKLNLLIGSILEREIKDDDKP